MNLKSEIKVFIKEYLALNLNRKTSIFPIAQGVDFLGYRTWTTHKLIRKRSVKKMRRKLRAMSFKYATDKMSLSTIKASLMSWIGHCKHANTYRLRQKILGEFVLARN